MSFQLSSHFSGNFPHIERELIGHYSVKEDENGIRQYDPGMTHLKYYKRPLRFDQLSFDLNLGYDKTRQQKRAGRSEGILYQWIVDNFHEVYKRDDDGQWSKPDFICFCGLLTCLFCTVNKRDAWIICAVKFDNVIYLAEFETEKEKFRRLLQTNMDVRMRDWGNKFEQFLTSESPKKDPQPEEPLDESEKFYCVFKTKFGSNIVLYRSKMDGIESDEEIKDSLKGKQLNFVKLKTSKLLNAPWKINSFYKYKTIGWWSQSYLSGVKTIVGGFKNDDGIVRELKEFSLDGIAFKSRHIWNDNHCREFCSVFLEHMKKTVTKNYDECVYKFEWDPENCKKSIIMSEHDPKGEMSFLPEWYINQMMALKEKHS